MAPLLRLSASLAPAFLLVLFGCASEPASDQLAGSWHSAAEDLSPAGWYQSRLTFRPSGMFAFEVRTYGLYEGQARNDLSAYSTIEGLYEVKADQLIFRPRSLTWLDRFYGANAQEQVEEPYDTSLFDDAHFTIQGDQLLLQYLSYPADAPVETSQVFARVD